MKKQVIQYFMLACTAVILISCGQKKAKSPEITEFDTYTDAPTQMSVKFPKNWVKSTVEGSRLIVYSSQEAKTEFLNMGRTLNEEDVPGARIDISMIKKADTLTVEKFIEDHKIYQPEIYKGPENITIDGIPAVKYTYSYPYKLSNLFGEIYFVTKDSVTINVITIDVIGDKYEELKPRFKEIISSMKVGITPAAQTPNTKTVTKEADPPSTTFKAVSGDGFSMQIPDNFKLTGSAGKYTISGDRRGDCVISISTLDSKGVPLDKILEQNASLGAASKTSIGGNPAGVINYKSKADLDSKIYFVVHNGKLFKIFATYYKPEAESYRPAFSKMISSIKFK